MATIIGITAIIGTDGMIMIMESDLRLISRWCRNGAGIVGATGSRVNGEKRSKRK